MTCAAVSGPMARSTRPPMTKVQPDEQRHFPERHPRASHHEIVVTMLMAVPMLPKPDTRSDSVQ